MKNLSEIVEGAVSGAVDASVVTEAVKKSPDAIKALQQVASIADKMSKKHKKAETGPGNPKTEEERKYWEGYDAGAEFAARAMYHVAQEMLKNR